MNPTAPYPRVTLKKGRDASARRFHPWVFSGGIDSRPEDLSEGDPLELYSSEGEFLGTGFFGEGDIAVKLVSFRKVAFEPPFWNEALSRALSLRRELGLAGNPHNRAYRLVNGEGDSLPGLIVDLYNDTAVLQCHSLWAHRNREQIAKALAGLIPGLRAVYDRSSEALTVPGRELTVSDECIWGELEAQQTVLENGLKFKVDLASGQKTGFYCDQRENRSMLRDLVSGKRVLNAFSYTGGFTLYALAGGAREVHSLDSSRPAMQLLEENLALNGIARAHQCIVEDAFQHLSRSEESYDLVVLDPPPFARHRGPAVAGALKGYRALNYHGLKRLARGGLLMTFSCSGVVSRADFVGSLDRALAQAGRRGFVVRQLHAAACHPVSLHHPEGEYLKGLLLRVD